VNSGVYSGFGCQAFDHEYFKGQPLLPADVLSQRVKAEKPSFIWGQTCDGLDWLMKEELYPEVNEGEWLLYRNMGAYN
jgi:ornithine decarboxylase